jgi:hypothetical protein
MPNVPTTPEILATRANTYRGWRLHTACGKCGRGNFLEVAELPEAVQALTLLEVIARLRCKTTGCGGKPRAVEILHHMKRHTLLGPEPP